MTCVLQSTQRPVHRDPQLISLLHETLDAHCITLEQVLGEASWRVHYIELTLQLLGLLSHVISCQSFLFEHGWVIPSDWEMKFYHRKVATGRRVVAWRIALATRFFIFLKPVIYSQDFPWADVAGCCLSRCEVQATMWFFTEFSYKKGSLKISR